ncbi:VHS-domain-containing protein [Artomyces pyxidatus]|uniref:VHS-domain-containing protein n=1 Tax=Artomyces pyxidatus TaxID=48021 RepID=A0ACB8SKC8_9AGAM|nr:VHS-domain-containing protein [Artomyces pyxidatus]
MWNDQSPHFIRASPLEILITRATTAALPENNYALHLEVAEYINQKKANTPREAAMLIARQVNHRNPHVSLLALGLLDTLVQSCGYPFHLQVATKEFLNELVRRFPERPPPFPGPVMSRILELIQNWKDGICQESRWRDDLGNIRDMHRLLSFKGYRFRDLPRHNSNSAPTAVCNLKSAEELESEDREAQSAKLQELIRRGTPRDLAAAQELMKSLAGANPESKPDYRTQALTELNKLEQKVILLNEMLDNADTERGERFAKGDVYDQVASILMNSRPKIQKWISDAESDDPESLDTYLQINDQINTVLDRYEAYKKGDYAAAANPIPKELGPGKNDLSLIDFDDAPPAQPGSSSGLQNVASGNPIDELMSLFGSPTNAPLSPAPPPIAASSNGSTSMPLSFTQSAAQPMAAISPQFTSSPPGSVAHQSRPSSQFGQIMLPGTPTPQPQPQPPLGLGRMGSSGFAGGSGAFGSTQSPMASTTTQWPQPLQPQTQHIPPQSQSQHPPRQTGQPAPAKDPFADLAGLF